MKEQGTSAISTSTTTAPQPTQICYVYHTPRSRSKPLSTNTFSAQLEHNTDNIHNFTPRTAFLLLPLTLLHHHHHHHHHHFRGSIRRSGETDSAAGDDDANGDNFHVSFRTSSGFCSGFGSDSSSGFCSGFGSDSSSGFDSGYGLRTAGRPRCSPHRPCPTAFHTARQIRAKTRLTPLAIADKNLETPDGQGQAQGQAQSQAQDQGKTTNRNSQALPLTRPHSHHKNQPQKQNVQRDAKLLPTLQQPPQPQLPSIPIKSEFIANKIDERAISNYTQRQSSATAANKPIDIGDSESGPPSSQITTNNGVRTTAPGSATIGSGIGNGIGNTVTGRYHNRHNEEDELIAAKRLATLLISNGIHTDDVKRAIKEAAHAFKEARKGVATMGIGPIQTSTEASESATESASSTTLFQPQATPPAAPSANPPFSIKQLVWPCIHFLLDELQWDEQTVAHTFTKCTHLFVTDPALLLNNLTFFLASESAPVQLFQAQDILYADNVQHLTQIVNERDVRVMLRKAPQLLLQPHAQIEQVLVLFINTKQPFLNIMELSAMLKKCPLILTRTKDHIQNTINHVLESLEMTILPKTAFTIYPEFLLKSPQEINQVLSFFMDVMDLQRDQLAAVLRAHPHILSIDVEIATSILNTLRDTLTVSDQHIKKIIQTFPAILRNDAPQNFSAVITYFKSKGLLQHQIQNIICTLPPVLIWDIEEHIEFRWNFIQNFVLSGPKAITTQMIAEYPGILAHSVVDRMWPRVNYLRHALNIDKGLADLDLKQVIGPSDEEFLTKIGRTKQDFDTFKKSLPECPYRPKRNSISRRKRS